MLVSPGPVGHYKKASEGIRSPWFRGMSFAVGCWLLVEVAIGLFRTRHWPLVNDGALIHYISFMMDGGSAPYRQLLDMDLPGTFLLDWSVVHVLGPGPVAWRFFDAFLLLSATAAMVAIARPYGRFAGVFGGCLFWLLHLRDGIGQAGQRDLIEAMMLLAMVGLAFQAVRSGRLWPLPLSGCCAGIAVTIKPDCLVLALMVLALLLQDEKRRGRPVTAAALLATSGFLIPMAAVGVFLVREHALSGFWTALTEVIP